jgi:hypothetical protein
VNWFTDIIPLTETRLSDTKVLNLKGNNAEQGSRRLKPIVGASLLALTSLLLVGATVPEQDLSERFLLLATSRTGTMQQELDKAAAAGYRILTGSPSGGWEEMALVLEKVVAPPDTYQYRLLATTRTGTMQRELDQAAAEGFRLLPNTLTTKAQLWADAREIVMIMEKPPNSTSTYQYMLLATFRSSTMQTEMAEAIKNGYEVVGMVSRDEIMLVLERSDPTG